MLSHCWIPSGHIEAHLRHPHCWVWLTASQIFGQLFAAQPAEKLVAVWKEGGGHASSIATGFITSNLDKKVGPRSDSAHIQTNFHISSGSFLLIFR